MYYIKLKNKINFNPVLLSINLIYGIKLKNKINFNPVLDLFIIFCHHKI